MSNLTLSLMMQLQLQVLLNSCWPTGQPWKVLDWPLT